MGTKKLIVVAPRVGAWIETQSYYLSYSQSYVAPRVGAWIETHTAGAYHRNGKSHPEWVRGLKQIVTLRITQVVTSHPEWVRGLKHPNFLYRKKTLGSHPEWVRGLKLQTDYEGNVKQSRTPSGCVD